MDSTLYLHMNLLFLHKLQVVRISNSRATRDIDWIFIYYYLLLFIIFYFDFCAQYIRQHFNISPGKYYLLFVSVLFYIV
jgi:hypothetical protein